MLTVYQAAYEGKLFIVQQMVEKEPSLVQSFDEVKLRTLYLYPIITKEIGRTYCASLGGFRRSCSDCRIFDESRSYCE